MTTSAIEQEVPHPPSPYDGRRITVLEHLILAAYWFGSNFVWGAFLGPVLSSQMTQLAGRTSAETLGVMYTIGAFPALLIPLFAGPFSDRCRHKWGRRRPYILAGGVLTLLGIGVMAGAYGMLSLPLYIFGYLVIQVGANTALGAYSGIIPDLVPVDQRGTASGFMALMSQLATLFGALISGFMISEGFSNEVFGVMAIVFAAFVGISVLFVKESPLTAEVPKFSMSAYLKSLWIDPRKYPDFAWVWITRALMMYGFYQIQPFLLYYLRDVIGVENAAAVQAIVFGTILLAATISGFLGGKLSDRTGRKPVVIWASVLISVTCLVFVFLRSLEVALAVGVLFGIGYGAYISVDWALGADVLPNKKDAGKDMAVWHVSMTLPQQVAPLVAGFILAGNRLGYIVEDGNEIATYSTTGYGIVFLISAVAFFLGGILVKNVRGAR